eukprot:1151766-Alexandrium_andersonii.AAC.1
MPRTRRTSVARAVRLRGVEGPGLHVLGLVHAAEEEAQRDRRVAPRVTVADPGVLEPRLPGLLSPDDVVAE